MAVREIINFPDPVLRRVCAEVSEVTPEIKKLLNDMAETMYAAPGIGLAACQVAIDKRVIVVDVGEDESTDNERRLYKLVNPVLKNLSGSVDSEEGCLSLPGIRETIKRAATVTLEAHDIERGDIVLNADGLLAICLQHEVDHLNGVLFIDRLSRLKRDLLKTKLRQLEKQFVDK